MTTVRECYRRIAKFEKAPYIPNYEGGIIGCLAPCELEYDLDGRFLLFSATVAIDHKVDGDSTDPHGDVTFQVWAAEGAKPGPDDWKLLQEVKKLTTQSPAGILVDVTGKA